MSEIVSEDASKRFSSPLAARVTLFNVGAHFKMVVRFNTFDKSYDKDEALVIRSSAGLGEPRITGIGPRSSELS